MARESLEPTLDAESSKVGVVMTGPVNTASASIITMKPCTSQASGLLGKVVDQGRLANNTCAERDDDPAGLNQIARSAIFQRPTRTLTLRHTRTLTVLAALVVLPASPGVAQTLRNPVGVTPSQGATSTARNPSRSAGTGSSQPTPSAAPTRPAAGSAAPRPTPQAGGGGPATTAPGHTIGVGPAGPGGTNGTGLGGGAPGASNPGAANGGAGPAALSGSRPNGGAARNGSKGSSMRANGVQKLN